MLLLMLLGIGSQTPPPAIGVRAYAAVSFSLVDGGAISFSLVSGAEGSVS